MTTERRRARHVAACVALIACLTAGTALGGGIYLNEAYDVGFLVPTAWTFADDVADGNLTVQLQAPANAGQVILLVTPIAVADRAYWRRPLDDLLSDVWSGFAPSVPGSQPQRRYDARAPGRTLRALDFTGPARSGSLLLYVGPAHVFTFASLAIPDPQAQEIVRAGLDALLAHFGPARPMQPDAAPGPTVGTTVAANPIDAVPRTDPHDTAAPTVSPVAAYVGVFVGDRVRLELEASGDDRVGTLVVDGVGHPALARVVGERLEGTFEVAGVTYAFTVEQAGGVWWLESEGARFELRHER